MSAKQPHVDALLEALDHGRQAWVEGRISWDDATLMDQAPDMTIFGPFGGEAGGADNARQARVASSFHGGNGASEVVKVIVEGDLVVVVAVERNAVVFEGETEKRPWILRTTQIFRRVGDRWLRLHRHADHSSDVGRSPRPEDCSSSLRTRRTVIGAP